MYLDKNIKKIIVIFGFISLILGVIITGWGLIHLGWPKDLPWTSKASFLAFLITLTLCSLTIGIGSWWLRFRPIPVSLALALCIVIICGAIWPLIVVIWFVLSSVLLGKFVLSKFNAEIESNALPLQFLVGAGVYGTIVGLSAHFPINYQGIYAVMLLFPLVFWIGELKEMSIKMLLFLRQPSYDAKNYPWVELAICALSVIYLIVALMPEVGYDSLVGHLFVPAHLALRHKWEFDVTTYVWAVTTMLPDWIFSILYIFAGETAVRLINIVFIWTLALLLRGIVLWGGGQIQAVRWAVLILFSTPLTFTEGSSLFIESVWAAFLIAGLYSTLKISTSPNNINGWLMTACILLGCALAAKPITFTALPILAAVLLWNFTSTWKAINIKTVAFGFILFLVFGGASYITAWYLTSNPVFPYFNAIFKSPYFEHINFNNPYFNSGFSFDTFYKIIFYSGKYMEASPGASGFQWTLLLSPALFFLIEVKNIRGLTLFLIALFAMVAVFISQSYLRYVFPSWVLFSAVIGIVVGEVLFLENKPLIRRTWLFVSISTIGLNILFFSAGSFYRDFPLSSLGTMQNREEYLSTRLPIRIAVEALNTLNLERSPVAVFADPLMAGLSSDALYVNWYNPKFHQMINEAATEQEIANVMVERNIEFIVLDENWNGSVEKKLFIKNIVDPVFKIGIISINRFRSAKYRFKVELLKNPTFLSIEGWNVDSGGLYKQSSHLIQTTVNAPATQAIKIEPGKHYLNFVIARCPLGPTLGRVQVNWLSQGGKFISTNIKTFECNSSFTKEVLEVTAPNSATIAVVYASSHTLVPVEFKEVSFLK
jgi:hypothetical protein